MMADAMTQRKLSLVIEAGEDRCSYAYGKFCAHVRSSMKGIWSCGLFDKELPGDEVLQRLPECRAAEVTA